MIVVIRFIYSRRQLLPSDYLSLLAQYGHCRSPACRGWSVVRSHRQWWLACQRIALLDFLADSRYLWVMGCNSLGGLLVWWGLWGRESWAGCGINIVFIPSPSCSHLLHWADCIEVVAIWGWGDYRISICQHSELLQVSTSTAVKLFPKKSRSTIEEGSWSLPIASSWFPSKVSTASNLLFIILFAIIC